MTYLLAAVLAVNGADVGTVASTADNLERAFGVGNTQIGLLLTIVSITGAVFTVPAGAGGPGGGAGGVTSAASSAGLEYTFLLFLGALLVAGLFALTALRTYPRDVATAVASADAIAQAGLSAPGSRRGAGGRTAGAGRTAVPRSAAEPAAHSRRSAGGRRAAARRYRP